MTRTTLRWREEGKAAAAVSVSFSELFFDLALVSSTARLAEYVEEVLFDLRFVTMMFSFWHIWHATNLIYNFTSASSTSTFRNLTLFIKLLSILTMSSCVTSHPTLATDRRFMVSYCIAKATDVVTYVRLHKLSVRDGFTQSVTTGLVANGLSNLIEVAVWMTCAFSVEEPSKLVVAMFVSQIFYYVVLRTCTQRIWRRKNGNGFRKGYVKRVGGDGEGENGEGGGEEGGKRVAFDFGHFRERQGLLVILVLGESIMSTVLTEGNVDEEHKGQKLEEQYAISWMCALVSYAIKILYLDSPLTEEFAERLESIEKGVSRRRVAAPRKLEILFFTLYAPLHAFVLGAVTCVASSFKLVLEEQEGGGVSKEVVNMLCVSLAVTLLSISGTRMVKYDTPSFDVMKEVTKWGADGRIVAEVGGAGVMIVLSFIEWRGGRVAFLATVVSCIGVVVAVEYFYVEWVLRQVENKLTGEEGAEEGEGKGGLKVSLLEK